VPGIPVFAAEMKDVDGRDKPGHDGNEYSEKLIVYSRATSGTR
jgi:hypothetical protein